MSFQLNAQSEADSVDAKDAAAIARSWRLPAMLKNISAVDYISAGKLACLSDEIGSIFIYNTETLDVEKEIPFGPPGDYEGIALVSTNAYIACADGRILEVGSYDSDSPEVKEYGTHLTVEEHVSGLCYDKRNSQLLVCVRGSENANQSYKSIYVFRLSDKRMAVKPAIKIDLGNGVFSNLPARKAQATLQPSDIHINPLNGLLYVIDGRGILVRMKLPENIRDLIELDKEKFFQPEGITITPSGEIYIASKGIKDEPGMLLQVRIK